VTRLLRLVAVDAGLLRRRRGLRLILAAQSVSYLGSTMTRVALPFLVYELTRSPFAVGLLGAVEVVPMLVVALLSGAYADAVDRRRLVVAAEIGGSLVAAVLLVNAALPDPQLWLIYVGAAAGTAFYALLRPPLDALIPRVVERDELSTAAALGGVVVGVVFMAGPAVAGVLIAATDVRVPLALDVASFAASAALLWRLPSFAPAEARRAEPVRDVREGLAYAGSRPELLGTYLVDMNAMVFGMPQALFPAIAVGLGGPKALGALYAAPAVGALLVSLTSGWTTRVRRQGRAILLAASGWGLAIAAFGLVDALAPALVLLAVAGGMDAVSGVFRSTLWNATIPDAMRGRLAGVEMVSWASGPGLGDLEAGAVAGLISVRAAVVSGGVICVAGSAALGAALPALWRYDAGLQPVLTHVHANVGGAE
jgi:MFS family permease